MYVCIIKHFLIFFFDIRSTLLKKPSECIQIFRLSSTTSEKLSSNGDNIIIPKHIHRSSTDILKVIISY